MYSNRRRTHYPSKYNFDGITFLELLETKVGEDGDITNAIINGANTFGGDFETTNKDILFLANNLIARFGMEPMRYKGALGWTKICLQFIETGTKYKLKMEELRNKLEFTDKDKVDAGSNLSNYAEDPESLDQSIDSDGKLNYINNQTYDKQKKGKLEATNDYYNSLRVSQVKNYLKDFEQMFGALCYYPSDYLAYSDEDEE